MPDNSSRLDGVQGDGKKRTEPYMEYGEGVSQPTTPQSAKSARGAAGSAGRQAGATRRIVIDARESGTSTGRYVDKLVEYLYKLKPEHEIIILTKPHRMEYFAKIAPGFKALESDYKEFTFSEQWGLLRQLNDLKADLVHFSMTQQPILYTGKSVTTVHDLTTARFTNPAKNFLLFKTKQQVYKAVIRWVAHSSVRIITPSEYVKKDLARFARVRPAKITVTYEAADRIMEIAKPVEGLNLSPFIMYVGRPQPHKNLRRLMEAFSLLRQKTPELRLVLVGKQDELYKRLADWAVSEHIRGVAFTGYVSEGQLKWLYRHAAAYVFPSLSEGFGLPALEAMVHGAPVVASNATCLPEVYGDAAHYFDPKNVLDMSNKIGEVINDPHFRRDLVEKGLIQAKKYSWAKTAEQTLAVYQKALNT